MKIGFHTKRLKMRPMTDEEIQQIINDGGNERTRQSYIDKLEKCKADPENRAWYAPWTMELKTNGVRVGEAGFKGPALRDAVEITYSVYAQYESKGLATEAVKSMVSWAFESDDVFFVEALVSEGNLASVRILKSQGFALDEETDDGLKFVKTKPATQYMTIYMSIGLCAGMTLGMTAFDSWSIGTSVGTCLGLCFGYLADQKAKKALEAAVARRNAPEEAVAEEPDEEAEAEEPSDTIESEQSDESVDEPDYQTQ